MSTSHVPTLFKGFVDDAAVFPPGSATLSDAIEGHRRHRAAWYSPLVGRLLLPASALAGAVALLNDEERVEVGVISDAGLTALPELIRSADHRLVVRQVEAAVARRGEDPQPGLADLGQLARTMTEVDVYAEIPLAWGLLGALDTVATMRADGAKIAPKFRTGGLAAELFPTPMELAAVICACRDRDLPFKLTAGLHRAVRHGDSETGFIHHGFLNVLAGALVAGRDAEVALVAERLASTDAMSLTEAIRPDLDQARPLWTGFGSCSVLEPLTDLQTFGLVQLAGEAVPGR